MSQGLILPPGAFRLVLALAVVVSHISRLDIGRLAVLLFFLLSGYWTARIWTEKFSGTEVRRFYAARYLRIAPLFVLVTLGSALLLGKDLHPVNLTLLGVGSTDTDPTGVSWSLDVELQFYLLLPLVMAFLATQRLWEAFALSAVLAVLGWKLEASYGLVSALKYLPVFLGGTLIYTKAWKPGPLTAHLSLAGFLLMTGLTYFTPFLDKTHAKPFDQDIWAFVWMLPLIPYVAQSLATRSTKLDRDFGNWSFPLYLVHFPLIAWATSHFGYSEPVKLAAAVLAFAVMLAVYYLVDRPVDAWRVRLTEGVRLRPVTA